ncbi:MAG TPA: SPASM domain-containing protein, partial [Candidatus Glassbacteria bacterium]|nr:SPASM domain-containing protein [Candidatus Glassbacteria bacterium]
MKAGRGGQSVANALQTNALVIDGEWAGFLAEYRFLVGVSLDGPAEIHDRFRTDRQGGPTFERVMKGIGHLAENGVEFNILCMITSLSQERGREIYRWLVAQGFSHLQFIPCVEYLPESGKPAAQNVSPEGYGRFLCDVFDEWYYAGDVNRISVRTFDAVVGKLSGQAQLSLCDLGEKCDHYLVVEKDGGVYPCDFFVEQRYRLGSLLETPLAELFASDRQRSFASIKCDWPEACLSCDQVDLCCGGCPKDRLTTGLGRFGRESYLCAGLKMFFDHTRERFQTLVEMVQRQRETPRAPAYAAGGEPRRNDLCPCGSGKKYKHCCLKE